ncbi:flagellin [Aeromonas veronii]|uniref:flagellin n=1 Tax=Aeromonas veronii TaxID=654 RepID=UPI0035B771C8
MLKNADGSNNTDDRTALQQEYTQLITEINRVAKDTTFGGQNLLNGDYFGTFQVGADAGQTITFKMTSAFTLQGIAEATKGSATVQSVATADKYKVSKSATAVATTSVGSIQTASAAQLAMANLDFMIKVVDSKRAELGAVQNRFDSTIRNQANVSENVSAARSRIRDADFATETANLTKQNILQQAASTILSQANQRPQSALSLLQG